MVNKTVCLTQAIEITKAVAQGHNYPDDILQRLYDKLVELATDASTQK